MLTIARIFGKSPFAPLPALMSRVAKRADLSPNFFFPFSAANNLPFLFNDRIQDLIEL